MGWAGSLAAAYRLNPRKLAARGLDPCPNWTSESVLDHFVLERGVVRLSPSPYTGWRRESGRGHRHGLVPSWKAVQQTRATGTRGLAANSTGGKCRRRKDLALPHLPNCYRHHRKPSVEPWIQYPFELLPNQAPDICKRQLWGETEQLGAPTHARTHKLKQKTKNKA